MGKHPHQKFLLLTVLFLSVALAPSLSSASGNKYNDYKKTVENSAASAPAKKEEPAVQQPEALDEKSEGQEAVNEEQTTEGLAQKEEECPYGQHACDVDKKIKEIQDTLIQVTDTIQKGSDGTYESPLERTKIGKTIFGNKALKYVIKSPTYIIRAATWPFGVVTKALIQTGVVEKVIDVISNNERTFWVYPNLELGFGYGFGGGVGIKHTDLFHKNYKFAANYKVHLNLNMEADIRFGKPDAAIINDKPLSYNIYGTWTHHFTESYYGIGAQSSVDNQGIYKLDSILWGANLGYELVKQLTLLGDLSFKSDWTDSGRDGNPSVENLFTYLPGFKDHLMYFIPRVILQHDTRDNESSPQKGGIRKISIGRFQGLNRQDFDFNEYAAEVSQFFRLWAERHVAVLRTKWVIRQGTKPFYELVLLDVNSPMHGFANGRFRDDASVAFNVAYRFPVWAYLDGEMFFDTGRVFRNFSDVSFNHFKFDGGGGLRVRTKNFFLMRFQVAYGGEGVKLLFSTSQEF